MMKKFRVIPLFLALLTLASCGGGTVTPDDGTKSPDVGDSDSQESSQTTVFNLESSGIEIKNFEGREFTVLTTEVSNHAHTWRMIDPDEVSGESLNDAMYNRNRKIEEKYNVKISSSYTNTVATNLGRSIAAGDDDYASAFAPLNELLPLAEEGKLANYYDLDNINLKADYWDQSLIDGLTYKNSLYVLTGEISPALNSRVYTLVFNKDLCTDLKLEMPYQYVLDGSWTIDRFNKYISDVNSDLNGDSKMDFNDRWGFLSQNGGSYMMYFSGGGQVVSKNNSGDLEIAMNSERNIELATKAIEIMIDKNKTLMAEPYVEQNGGSWSAVTSWFSNGGALFRSSVLEPVPRDLRSLDVNFGILPFPKLDENQDKYYTLPEEYSLVFSIPVTADADFASLIMEALAVESVSTVSPAFYDICLNGKSVRDEESSEMLDIIFANKIFDLGYFANIANFRDMMTNFVKSESTDVASSYAMILDSAKAQLEKICGDFDSVLK